MSPTDTVSPEGGVKVPRWLVAAVVAVSAVASTGWALARAVSARDNRITTIEATQQTVSRVLEQKVDLRDLRELNTRLCRIERALRIEPWETCR